MYLEFWFCGAVVDKSKIPFEMRSYEPDDSSLCF